jgi:hypothetical protein
VAREFQDGWIVNLGVGIPTMCSNTDIGDRDITYHSENGVIGYGGVTAAGEEDLNLVNAGGQNVTLKPGAAVVHHADSFAIIRGGRIDFFFTLALSAVPLIESHQVSALAVSSLKRSAALPDVPTTLEAGYPNSDYVFWVGVFAPAATPRAIIDRLHDETAKVLADPAMRETLKKLGADAMEMTPAEFDIYIRSEIGVNAALVKAAGIKPIE